MPSPRPLPRDVPSQHLTYDLPWLWRVSTDSPDFRFFPSSFHRFIIQYSNTIFTRHPNPCIG